MYRCSSVPARIAAMPRVTLRVTKVPPRRGDSWVNRIPLLACSFQASRYWIVIQWAKSFAIAYGLRGWNGLVSDCLGGVLPNISLDPAREERNGPANVRDTLQTTDGAT